ncbi:4-hydroxy-2-oxovalerate aldolase [Priestia taiwanensis]|uniref:4-hydroxy-2-oxovalerate aldolase n=1 Tax=Priestia taiwanensis TaxID=1347902 RepID=A0A917AMA2_9BACI|nr:4-hydroxy-2-oxovalerate aldolase [Priestia taiwanensis]MBM7362268.1 4-hydroxy 2-oxovalerate aldolase [Priestia taiwanensis]GGE60843.1 4-hydroxy-2-oxovalerate aldolase [Priestia taiwanensis]
MKRHSDKPIKLTEVCLRDGSHVVRHQYSVEQVVTVAKALDDAGVPYIEVSHGDGLGGSTLQYGKSLVDEMTLIEEASKVCTNAKISTLLLPGIGTVHDLREAYKRGAGLVRVATHVTEADVAEQHISFARELGMEVHGFLMMAHSAPVSKLVEQANLMEQYGAGAVYITDSAGALLPSEVKERVKALRESLNIEIGFHAHNNLSLAVANTLVAIEEGATRIDGSVRCLGAGAGNTQTEVLVAVLNRMGMNLGIDLYKIMDIAEEIIGPILPSSQEIKKGSLTLGYAGVYSSFLLFAERAGKKYGIDPRDILIELGRRKAVGGQEDMIVDVTSELVKQKVEVINR